MGPVATAIEWVRRPGRAVLGWSYRRLYDELAWAYDGVSWMVSGGRWQAWQRAVYSYLVPGPTLEIGPGTGHLLADLLARGYAAYGLECSPAMLRRARRLLAQAGYCGRLVGGDALSLPFAGGAFSSVVLTFPADYVSEPRFLAEVARMLRPDGRLVMVLGAEAGTWPWPGLLEWALRWLTASPGESSRELAAGLAATGQADATLWPGNGLAGEYLELRGPLGTIRLLVAARGRQSPT